MSDLNQNRAQAPSSFKFAKDKLAFLLSLVPFLIERDEVTVAATARHFDVSEDTIREAVNLLIVSGIPGESDFYQHGDLFDIDWDALELRDEIILTQLVAIDDSPRFSAREAAALIAGLQYLQSLPENAGSSAYAHLAATLARGSSGVPSEVAVAPTEGSSWLAPITAALTDGTRLRFSYLNSQGGREQREVDPLRVDSTNDDWYLRGWDHGRGAIRTYRLDRIDALETTTEPIEFTAGDVHLSDALFDASAHDLIVVLEFPTEAVDLLGDYVPEGTRVTQDGEFSRASVRVAHFHGLKRLVTSLAGVARVVSPPEARMAVAEWAAAGAARYAAAGAATSNGVGNTGGNTANTATIAATSNGVG
jgi:proteasome accessory factor C